jgi:hypothetical protein
VYETPVVPMSASSGSAGPAGERDAASGRVRLTVVFVIVGVLAVGGVALAVARHRAHGGAPTSSPTARAAGASVVAAAPAVCTGVTGETVMADGMVMAPVPHRAPAPTDLNAATRLIASVRAGISKYSHLSAAVADGYVPATNPNGYVVHYADWAVVRAGDVLDPNHPSSLVYANTVSGPVLLGAMFLGPAPCQPGPDVAGPLTQWHAHANLCLSATHEVVGRSNASGQCAVGKHNTNTFFMMHVWIAPSLAQSYQFAADVPAAAYAAIIRSGRA